MRVTRRYWAITGLAIFLAGLAVLFARPLLFVGAVGIGAWLLVRQYVFVHTLAQTLNDLNIEQAASQQRVIADNETAVTLSAAVADPSPVDITIEAMPPVTATGSTQTERTIHISRNERTAGTTFSLRWSVAGSFQFGSPRITATDADRLFHEQLTRGPAPSVIVEPRGPRNIHVGEGGEQLTAYGEHQSRTRETGLDPGELREYVSGDPARRIDWKTTARLNTPHVREYETESDRTIAMLVDHREPMSDGSAGETKLDYVRQVALGFTDNVRETSDPLGYYAVGDEGVTDRREPANGQHAHIKRQLHKLQSTTGERDRQQASEHIHSPAAARRAATRLQGERAFDTTLRPYFAAATTYVERIEDDPLFETARTYVTRLSGAIWTVIFTDDTHRAEVRETVKLVRRSEGHVLVFLTPSVLFTPGGLADLENAYERYHDFETFRRQLSRLERVTAFEVGPGDRLDAVLAAGRRRRSPNVQ